MSPAVQVQGSTDSLRTGEGSSEFRRCEVWGVLNITSDSFSDGSLYLAPGDARAHALRLLAEGADVIDVGGESSRPAGGVYGAGATAVDAQEETRRVVPVIEVLANEQKARVSIDTVKAEVAEAAIRAGARIVNDVSCGASEALLVVVATHGVELVVMHNRRRGEVDGVNNRYEDLVRDVRDELLRAVDRATHVGVDPRRIWIDPGFGFAKNAEQSMALLAALADLTALGHRVLVGPSRKAFLGAAAPAPDGRIPPPLGREAATIAAVVLCASRGASAVRVHDVAGARQALHVTEAALRARVSRMP